MEKLSDVTEIYIKQEENCMAEGTDGGKTVVIEEFDKRCLHDEDYCQEKNQIVRQEKHFDRMYGTNKMKSMSDLSENCDNARENCSANDFHVIAHGTSYQNEMGYGSRKFDERNSCHPNCHQEMGQNFKQNNVFERSGEAAKTKLMSDSSRNCSEENENGVTNNFHKIAERTKASKGKEFSDQELDKRSSHQLVRQRRSDKAAKIGIMSGFRESCSKKKDNATTKDFNRTAPGIEENAKNKFGDQKLDERSLLHADGHQPVSQKSRLRQIFERGYKAAHNYSKKNVNRSTNDYNATGQGIKENVGNKFGNQELDKRVKLINSSSCGGHAHVNLLNNKREETVFVSSTEIPSDFKNTPQESAINSETQFYADVEIKLERDDLLLTELEQVDFAASSDAFCSVDPLLQIQCIKEEKDVSEFESFHGEDSASFGNVSLTHSTTLFPRCVQNNSLEDIFDLKPCQVEMRRIRTCSDIKGKDKLRNSKMKKSKIRNDIVRKSEVRNKKIVYTCDHCQKTYSLKSTLSWHIFYSHLSLRFCCKFCRLLFNSQAVLRKHLLSTHKNEGKHWECEHCKRLFFKRRSYVNHRARMLSGDSMKFNCGPCKKSFPSKCSLRKHCHLRHGGDFVCKVCNSVFTDASNLHRHLRSVHRVTAKNKTLPCPECNVCGRSFSRLDALRKHVLREHSDCSKPENPKLPKHRVLLNEKHLQSGKQLHECGLCGALFTQKCHLQRHGNIHNGVKFMCPLCGQKFADKSNLRKHNLARHSSKVTVKRENDI